MRKVNVNVSRALGVMITVLLLAGVGAAVVQNGDDGPSTVIDVRGAGGGADEGASSSASATTTMVTLLTTLAPTVATTAAPVTSAPAAVTAAPATAAQPATTAPPRARSFDMTPTSGPPGTLVKTAGGGCQGENYGVVIYIQDPSGQAVDGDGGSTQPDGSWTLEFHMGHYQAGPGKYTIRPVCMNGASTTVFEYTPMTFTVT